MTDSETRTTNNNKLKEKTYIRDLGFALGSNVTAVDVNDGKILRLKPFHFDWKYDREHYNPGKTWKIEARGKIFEPTNKSLITPLSLTYKKRTYSPNRIKYPLKRVDWDPDGERNPQNRSYSQRGRGFRSSSDLERLSMPYCLLERRKPVCGSLEIAQDRMLYHTASLDGG